MPICIDKNCALAGIDQPLENFSVNLKLKSGIDSKCRACKARNWSEWYRSTKDIVKTKKARPKSDQDIDDIVLKKRLSNGGFVEWAILTAELKNAINIGLYGNV